jgi:hypothetical protein
VLKLNKQINIKDYSFLICTWSICGLIVFYDQFFINIIPDNSLVYMLFWILIFANMIPGIDQSNKVSRIINWILK